MRNAEQQHDSKSRRASLKHWLLICLLCWFTAVTGSAVAQVTLPGAGLINTVAGTGTNGYSGDGGLATNAELSSPDGAAVDSAGNIYVADTQNCSHSQVDSVDGHYLHHCGKWHVRLRR